MGKKLEIVFRPNEIDTEKVREAIEDTMGVEILEINDLPYPTAPEKQKSPCELLDDMIKDEHEAPAGYDKVKNALLGMEGVSMDAFGKITRNFIPIIIDANSADERKHEDVLKKLRTMVC